MNRRERRRVAALNRSRQTGYLHRVLAALQSGAIDPTPGVHHAAIEHDRWCGIYRGRSCDCVPDISVCGPDGATVIDERGQVARKSRVS